MVEHAASSSGRKYVCKYYMSFFLDSSMVEHAAVNRGVVGSSPTRGVFLNRKIFRVGIGPKNKAPWSRG